MNNIIRNCSVLSIFFFLIVSACGPRLIHDAYLANVVEQADANQVRQQMGPPDDVKPRTDGGEQWTYREYQPTYPTKEPGLCSEYILNFDSNQVFRDWKRKDCGMKKEG